MTYLTWKFLFFLYLAAAVIVTAPAGAAQAGPPREGDLAAPALDDPAPSARWDLLAEVVKQAAEQPLHFVMSAGPIWLSRCLTAVPWYGWAIAPALAYREWRQWPSRRWWDPALDAAFLVLGMVAATWSDRAMPGPLPLAAMRRRDWRTALAHLAPAMIRRPLPAKHALS
jgi:hypothetical protein